MSVMAMEGASSRQGSIRMGVSRAAFMPMFHIRQHADIENKLFNG
jgi:hypothetical protein